MFNIIIDTIADIFHGLSSNDVQCNHPYCYDQSQQHLMAVEFNQRHGMLDHFNPQSQITEENKSEQSTS